MDEKIKNIFSIYLTNISEKDIDSYLNYGDKILIVKEMI